MPLAEPARPRGPIAAQLAKECDDLLNSVVKRPYGWGWGEADTDPQKTPLKMVQVSLEPLETPSAAMVLWYAARLLEEPRYAEAAHQVARAVAASQAASGKFPSQPTFGNARIGNTEPARALPDRASTRACLALLFSLIDNQPPEKVEALQRAASRGTSWLLKQQTEPGGWPVLYPPDAQVKDASRIIRLDLSDTRDNVLAMLLAHEVMGDPFHRRSAERSVEFLMRLRTRQAGDAGGGLWQTAYTIPGQPVENVATVPASFDTLASRHAIQAIFATYVIQGEASRLTVCEQAGKSLEQLVKGNQGRWRRRYNLKGEAMESDQSPLAAESDQANGNDYGLVQLLQTISDARDIGREKFLHRLRTSFQPREHLAQALAGLSQLPMLLDFPDDKKDVDAYLKRHERQLILAEARSLAPESFAARIERFWILFLRAKLEKALTD